jgi:hypothetical protein
MKSGSLSLLEPPGPVKACIWVALPFALLWEPQISQHSFLSVLSMVYLTVLSAHHSITALTCPVKWCWCYLFSRLFSPAVGHEAVHTPQSSAEVMNEWSYSSTPPTCLLGMQRDNFTVTTPSLSGICHCWEESQEFDLSFYVKYGLSYNALSQKLCQQQPRRW